MNPESDSFVAECFWPDVRDADVRALDERIAACLVAGVRYLGSILLREDEVVLCQFEGPAAVIREVAERANVPFERILATTYVPSPLSGIGGPE
jgi:hypothetical protein